MITFEQYKILYERLGHYGKADLSEQEFHDLREYECAQNDKKYGKEHEESHLV